MLAAGLLLRRAVSTLALVSPALCNHTLATRSLLVRPFAPLQLLHTMASVPPVHLVLDWDGTITHKDTLHFLGKICADNALARSNKQDDEPTATAGASWDELVKAYSDEYSSHAVHYVPKKTQRSTIAEEKEWLASIDPVESRSIRRVEKAGVFKGVTTAAVKDAAVKAVESGELALRNGWADALVQGSKITILSVNWSATFIRESLLAAVAKESDAELLQKAVAGIDIIANEIDGLDDPAGSSGLLNTSQSGADGRSGVRTSADKLANMPTPVKYGGDGLVVYVGDSATDFEALLAADVGICIRDEELGSGQKELADMLARVGVQVHRIKLLAEMPPADDSVVTMYWAKNLQEVALSLSSYP